ncbi:uncharacterized protein LOC134850889 isoform X2 [Symsagittifera roscoffensis]|uniref:uncharacterized protein LOC134850889 isoform X2 n=1 Tax=Symsagittifera roscoffensis TaxID=84072 RepID=UPI00307C8272
MTLDQSPLGASVGSFSRKSGGVRSSFKAAGRYTTNTLGVGGATAATMFEEKCCKCRFTIKHTSSYLQFHKQPWLPQKVGVWWHRKGKKGVYKIESSREWVAKPGDPYQGNSHFFNPADRTYDYVSFDAGFILKPSSDQFLKKLFKVTLVGYNPEAPKHKQTKLLGTGEVDLSSHAFEAYTMQTLCRTTGTLPSSGRASSTSSGDSSTTSRRLKVELVPKSEKVMVLTLDIEISCTMIAENVQLDDNEFWDASSASCGGSTNDDLLSLNSEFLESLDGSSSSPAVQNKLTRFQTMSPGDAKSKKGAAGAFKRIASFQIKKNPSSPLAPGSKSSASGHSFSSSSLLQAKARTASLSPSRDAYVQYQLPPVSKSRSKSVKPGDTTSQKELTKDTSGRPSHLTTNSQEMISTIPEVNTPLGTKDSEEENKTRNKFSESSEASHNHADEEKDDISFSEHSGSKFDQSMRNSFHETDADVTLSFETELDDKIPGHRVTESSDKLSSECQNGEKSKTLVDQSEIIINKTTVASSQNDQRSTEVVENHPLVMHELDDKSSSSGDHQGEVRQEKKAKVNPFLCDNADNQPFTSAECLIEQERLALRDFEHWLTEVIRGYPRIGDTGASVIMTLDPNRSADMSSSTHGQDATHDSDSVQLTCGMTLCAVLHRYYPQLIGNFNWLLEENDTQSEKYFKLALSTCDIVSIPTRGLTSEHPFQIAKQIHLHYATQPIPPLPDFGAATEQFEIKDLERTEDIKRKIKERTSIRTNSKGPRRVLPSKDKKGHGATSAVVASSTADEDVATVSNAVEMEEKNIPMVLNGSGLGDSSLKLDDKRSSRASTIINQTQSVTESETKGSLATNKLESGAKIKAKLDETQTASSQATSNSATNSPKAAPRNGSLSKDPIFIPLDEPEVTNEHNGSNSNDVTSSAPSQAEGVDEKREEQSNSKSDYYESEEAMCESLRRNWRTMIGKKRLLLENRLEEIDTLLNKLRTQITQDGVTEEDIIAGSMEMITLTNEKSDLMLEFDDIDIMEEDLDLQEKADQVKHQLRLLQMNKEVEGTEEKEEEERRLVELFRSLMDERNALVEKVDNRRVREGMEDEQDEEGDPTSNETNQSKFKFATEFLTKDYFDKKKHSKMNLMEQYLKFAASTRISNRASVDLIINGTPSNHRTLGSIINSVNIKQFKTSEDTSEDGNDVNKCGVM